ncbi:MAG: hypothetical protein PVI40_03070 [Chlamydiota bacterium]|jgi:hypothetical protein
MRYLFVFLMFVSSIFANTFTDDKATLSDELDYFSQKLEELTKQSEPTQIQKTNKNKQCNRIGYIEILPGYFYPTDRRIRETYQTGGFNGQVELGFFPMKYLVLWTKGGAYWRDGLTRAQETPTSLLIGSLAFGAKGVYPIIDYLHIYAGIGPRVFFLRIKNNSDFVQRRVNETKVGGAFQLGFWIFPKPSYPLFFDLFVDYSVRKFKFGPSIASERNNINVNGPTVGLGMGCQF